MGATMHTYLLERSRVVFQPQTERNYHIFYQLCAGAPLAERKELSLADYTEFNYLNQGQPGLLEDVDDAEAFGVTNRAFSLVGVTVNIQWQIYRLLAAILHIGNIKISRTANVDQSDVKSDDPSLIAACDLLGVPAEEFVQWITKKLISAGLEKILSPLSQSKANASRDAVSKISLLFWIFMDLNIFRRIVLNSSVSTMLMKSFNKNLIDMCLNLSKK